MKFLQFIKYPESSDEFHEFSIKEFFKLCLFYFLAVIVIAIMIAPFASLGLVPPNKNSLLAENFEPLALFFYMVLIGPFFEEAIFRLNLKTNKINLISSLLIFLGFLAYQFFTKNSVGYLYKITLVFIVVILIFHLKYFVKLNEKKHFKLMFYFSAVAFGFMHVFNFGELTLTTLLLFPLITMPQIIMGFICGYLRINYGFIYGLGFHSIINFIAFTFMILLKS
jgi:membrane protease YdiL (CAAX protease family)